MGLSNETAFAISEQPESTLNAYPTLVGDYIGVVPDNPGVIFPEMEKSDDVGRAGAEFASQICNLYWLLTAISLPLRANFDDVGRLLLRTFSGEITTTTAGATGGTPQAETMVIVGTVSTAGSIDVIVTAAAMAGSPITVPVAVEVGDDASAVAAKVRTSLQAHSIIGDANTGFFTISGTGANVVATVNVPRANDGTMNLEFTEGDSDGLTADATSTDTTAGSAGTAAAWKHAAPMLPKSGGYQLKSSAVVVQNEGDDFIFGGMVINQLVMSQESTNIPTLTFDLIGTGIHLNPAGFTSPLSDSDVPCLDGAASQILYTDPDGDTWDLYETADVRSWSCTIANNLVTEPARTRSGGDPLIGPADGQARHIQKLKRGNRTATAQIVVVFGDDIPWWTAMARNDEFTDFTFKVNGPAVGGVALSLGVVFPVCTVRSTPGTDSQGDGAYTLNITAKKDPSTGVGATCFVVTDIETDFA